MVLFGRFMKNSFVTINTLGYCTIENVPMVSIFRHGQAVGCIAHLVVIPLNQKLACLLLGIAENMGLNYRRRPVYGQLKEIITTSR